VTRNLALGCITLVAAIAYYAAAAMLPQSQLDDAIGPQGLPKSYAIVLAGLSLILIAQSVRPARKDRPAEAAPRPTWRAGRLRILGMLFIGVVYIAAAPWLGYIGSIALLILATTYYQGGVLNRRVALVAVSGALCFWVLFVLMLGIPQPSGFWPSLF
jgi:putative tricarboxylic transport membrane protein